MARQHGADAVRARTLIRTLVLHADHANVLQDVLLSSEPLIARTTLWPATGRRTAGTS